MLYGDHQPPINCDINPTFFINFANQSLTLAFFVQVMSENISTATTLNGEMVTRQPLIKSMRVVKKETLKLISCWVERSNDANMVLDNFIPPLLDAVLLDYQRCSIPIAREPEVLSTMATIVNKLKSTITPQIPKIFDALFECTLDMINKVSFFGTTTFL